MANFFKSTCSNTLSEKRFANLKIQYSSLRFSNNGNVTKNTNVPVVSNFDQDATISPLLREIERRLKVLNKILPHENVVQLSQDFINTLNSACYDKIAESLRSNSANKSACGGKSIACSSVSHRTNAQSRPLPNTIERNKELISQMMFKAAKIIRSQNNLGIINKEPQPVEFTINSSQGKSKGKGRIQTTSKYTSVASSSNGDDSVCFCKPVVTVQNRKQRSDQKKIDSLVAQNNIQRRKQHKLIDVSAASCDLTISRTSLQSSTLNKPKNISKYDIDERRNKPNESDSHNKDENPDQDGESDGLMLQIQSRPKKTALSPFSRFKKQCPLGRATSTPFKLQY